MHRYGLGVLATVLLTSPARAATPERGTNPEPKLDIGARASVLGSAAYFAPFGAEAHVELHYRVSPLFRVGAYAGFAHLKSTSSDHYDYEGQVFSAWRAGTHLELHALPQRVVDPWLGAGLGTFVAQKQEVTPESGAGLDLSLDAGVDFRVSRSVTVGGVFMFVVPVTNTGVFGGDGFAEGTYFSGLGAIPLPALRFNVAF